MKGTEKNCGLLSNHLLVLICLSAEPKQTLRSVAHDLELTERAVQRIVADLEEGGCLTRQKVGRQNQYTIAGNYSIRTKVGPLVSLSSLLGLWSPERKASSTGADEIYLSDWTVGEKGGSS